MNEKELNRAIAASFNSYYKPPAKDSYNRDEEPTIPILAYKIPDPSWPGAKGQKRPFDGFAVYWTYTIFWESKFQRGYHAFPLNVIQPHQAESMKRVRQPDYNRIALVIFGINEPGRGTDVFFLDYKLVWFFTGWQGWKSIPADSFVQWKKLELYRPLKKGRIDLEGFPNFVISTSDRTITT